MDNNIDITSEEYKDARNKLMLFLDDSNIEPKMGVMIMINICGATIATSDNVEYLEAAKQFMEDCYYMTQEIIESEQKENSH